MTTITLILIVICLVIMAIVLRELIDIMDTHKIISIENAKINKKLITALESNKTDLIEIRNEAVVIKQNISNQNAKLNEIERKLRTGMWWPSDKESR